MAEGARRAGRGRAAGAVERVAAAARGCESGRIWGPQGAGEGRGGAPGARMALNPHPSPLTQAQALLGAACTHVDLHCGADRRLEVVALGLGRVEDLDRVEAAGHAHERRRVKVGLELACTQRGRAGGLLCIFIVVKWVVGWLCGFDWVHVGRGWRTVGFRLGVARNGRKACLPLRAAQAAHGCVLRR